MSEMTPADVIALAREQEDRAAKILNGDIPAPNPIVGEYVQQFKNIMSDYEKLSALKRKLEAQLSRINTDLAKLAGARENCERNVVKMEWLFAMAKDQVTEPKKEE